MNAGARIAITRDERDDGALAQALLAVGLIPCSCRVVSTEPSPEPARLADAARHLERYDWLLVASRRSAEAVAAARGSAAWPSALRGAAVGAASARALRALGCPAPVTATQPGAAALVAMLQSEDRWPGLHVLLPRALDGGTELAAGLRALGATVEEVVAYRTVARPAAEIRSVWEAARADAVVFASPSAARALVGAIGAGALRGVTVVAIGETTAAELAGLGVAAERSETASFTAIAERLSASSPLPREVSR